MIVNYCVKDKRKACINSLCIHIHHRPAGAPWASKDFAQVNDKRKKRDNDGSGMPLLLTAVDGSTLVASPLVDFFTSAQTASKAVGNFSFGMQGTVENVPKGHVHYTLLIAGKGVRSAAFQWGEVMMQASGGGKTRSMRWTQSGDVSLRSLSYYTDNGAYYYYQVHRCAQQTASSPPARACKHGRHTHCSYRLHVQTANDTGSCSPPHSSHECTRQPLPQDASGYQQTLRQVTTVSSRDLPAFAPTADLTHSLKLAGYFSNISLPVRALQVDSWWYYKGDNNGVDLWEPMPSTLGGAQVRRG